MPKIDLSRVPEAMNSVFVRLLDEKKPLCVLVGGANSGKSFSTAQKVVYKMLVEKGHRFILARKVKKDVRHSVYDTVKAVIGQWNMEPLFKYNDTESSVTCLVNGNDALGVGLDDVGRLKSIFDPTDFWLEEADQATKDDVAQLRIRLRGNVNFPLQGTLTLNPVSSRLWIKGEYCTTARDDVCVHYSTYKDNRFVNAQAAAHLEGISDRYYRDVYLEGRWGSFEGGVFSSYVVEDFLYDENDFEDVCQGMDFGFVHAQVIIRCGFRDGELYVFDELYSKGRTNAQFIQDAAEYFGEKMFSWQDITCDSANPDKIKEWNDSGIRAEPAKKGDGSLRYGIEYLVGHKIHIHGTRCPHLIRELELFHRAVDKDGNVTERFVEINDDCIAALRYATEWIWSRGADTVADFGYGASYLGL